MNKRKVVILAGVIIFLFLILFVKRNERVIEEASSMNESKNETWWVNSGGEVRFKDEIGSTMQGELLLFNKWRMKYFDQNPFETDNGEHPQNIFRLIRREKVTDVDQTVYVRIKKIHVSNSSHRNESNGILLFSRYVDADNLYYAGIRVDGTAVVKRKGNSEYITIDQVNLVNESYDREINPNVLPVDQWIGIRTSVKNRGGGVGIRVFIDLNNQGKWKKVIEVIDKNESRIRGGGFTGLRTDFMDVEFRDYNLTKFN